MKHIIHPLPTLIGLAAICWVPGNAQTQSSATTVPVASPPVAESIEASIQGGTAVLHRVVLPGRTRTERAPAPAQVTTRAIRPPLPTNLRPWVPILLSATVYDHSRTLLRWWISGEPSRSYVAWSNVDFNHFSGVGLLDQNGERFALFMGISNQDTIRTAARMAAFGRTYQRPAIPELPEWQPSFLVVEGDPADAAALRPIMALHEYYLSQRVRLAAAYAERERQRVASEAAEKARALVPVRRALRHYSIPPRENPIPHLKGGER